MASVAEHKLHVIHESLLADIAVSAYIALNAAQVYGLQYNLVVIRVVLLWRLHHEEVTQASTCTCFSCLCHCCTQRFQPVFLGVLLMTRNWLLDRRKAALLTVFKWQQCMKISPCWLKMELTLFSYCFLCQGLWWRANCHPHHHLEVLFFLAGKERSSFLQQHTRIQVQDHADYTNMVWIMGVKLILGKLLTLHLV